MKKVRRGYWIVLGAVLLFAGLYLLIQWADQAPNKHPSRFWQTIYSTGE